MTLHEGDMWIDDGTVRVWLSDRNPSGPVCRWVDTGTLLRSTEVEATDRRIEAAASHVAASLNRLLDRTGHYPGDPIPPAEPVDGPYGPKQAGMVSVGGDAPETPYTASEALQRGSGTV